MRPVKVYTFSTGTKFPFSQLGETVCRYLKEQHLTSHSFFYSFSSIDRAAGKNGCSKILKDLPKLGEPSFPKENIQLLSNLDCPGAVAAEDVLPLMGKIHRTYGFLSADLWFFDVNFFGSFIPCRTDMSHAHTSFPSPQPAGSGILLHRGWERAWLELSFDLLRDGQIIDPTPYVEALEALLPGIRRMESTTVYLSPEETALAENAAKAAEPHVKEARGIIFDALDEKQLSSNAPGPRSFSKAMKKLGKELSYSCFKYRGGCAMEKRTASGNIIFITVGRERLDRYDGVDLEIVLQGALFRHRLGGGCHAPINQEEIEAFVNRALEAVAELEKEIIPTIEALYPPSPAWLEPVLIL